MNTQVAACVMVVCTLGMGKGAVAVVTEETGHSGDTFCAVIVCGGRGCIGAYFVSPVCWLYGMSKLSPAAAKSLAAASKIVGGPVVPVTVLRAEITS